MSRSNFLVVVFGLVAMSCGGGGNGKTETTYAELNCEDTASFDPIAAGLGAAIVTPTAGVNKNTSLILMHGKTGRPTASFLTSFQTDMAARGYKVIAPSMPWSTLTWHGSLCEGVQYIKTLANEEIAAGQDVVLVGHSMGAAYALMYAGTQSGPALKAFVSIAPGHFMHKSRKLQTATAADVARAKDLESRKQGNLLDTYTTLNGGMEQSITTTATRYLSFHDLDRVPAVYDFVPAIKQPVLWISGSDDPLTNKQDHASLASLIKTPKSKYTVLSADHLGVVALAPASIETWLDGL